MGERCTVEGTVRTVIFQNEENGYTVLTLAVDGREEPVTVVGCIPCADSRVDTTRETVRFALKPHKVFLFHREEQTRLACTLR